MRNGAVGGGGMICIMVRCKACRGFGGGISVFHVINGSGGSVCCCRHTESTTLPLRETGWHWQPSQACRSLRSRQDAGANSKDGSFGVISCISYSNSTRIYLQEPDKYGTRITAVPVLPPDVVGLPSVQRTSPQELVQRKHSEAQFRFWSSTSASLSGSRTAVRDEAWYAARLPLVRGFTWRLS